MKQLNIDSFLTLSVDSIIHLTPVGAKIIIENPPGSKVSHHVQPLPVATVNDTAREILLLSNGQNSVQDIINNLMGKADGEHSDLEIKRATTAFIKQAIEYRILSLSSTSSPSQQNINTTGSVDCFIPQHMSIELTSNCNLQCIYCYRDAGPTEVQQLEGETIISILEKLYDYGLRSVELTGGEPLLHPQFKEIFKFSATKFEQVALLSNGCLVNKDIAELLGKYRRKIIVQVDLDGSTPEMHNAIRIGAQAFQKAKNGIELLVAQGIKTRIAMNVTKDNVHDIEDTLLLAKRLGVTWFALTPVLDFGRGRDLEIEYSKEEIEYFTKLSEKLNKEHPTFFNYFDYDLFIDRFNKEGNCGAGHKAAVLGPTGKVRPCALLSEEVIFLGDLTSNSIPAVFSNPVVDYLHKITSPDENICSGCNYEYYCRHCISRGIATQSKLSSPCIWAKENELEKWATLEALPNSLSKDKSCSHCF